ncbi:AMP-binding protein [Actinosynnema sp. NPDC047251]|uniref:Non-ribosomal peptide synthetase n=1 Tax=Saccharothrix espanaensis (strain ATCC 51144 / DSM 44229 / JCM 9112 / NBRC 15066 / NRRL 15764) TaxID=1179773 RepID=K0JXZ7_SACES|nr:AMP-binding protein [Saccharothrix espanaensis]CCH29569.1 Non-ribosomal peptide synthetase [Saccharothrix espanaensis DSM 44229]
MPGDLTGGLPTPVRERPDHRPGVVRFTDGHGAAVRSADLTALAGAMLDHPALAGVERVTIVGRQSLRLVSTIAAAHLAGHEFAVVDAGEAPEIRRAHVEAFGSGAVIDLSEDHLSPDSGRVIDSPPIVTGDELLATATRTTPLGTVQSGLAVPQISEHAYTVRTSGTTGTPKLVQLTRTAFDQYVRQFVDRYSLDENSRLAVWAAPTYDAHHCQVFAALAAGAVGVVAGLDARRSGRSVLEWLRTSRVTHFETTPSILRALVAAAVEDGRGLPPDLTHVMCSGERFEPALARAVADLAGPLGDRLRLHNEFGPTECVLATWHEITAADLDLPDLPLGTAIPGRVVDVLPPDGAGAASPDRPGEIVIRSPHLCPGYGVAGAHTGTPFPLDANGVLTFHTGDLGYVDERGLLRLRGRRDRVVKRRGVKIDLDDVERAFRAIPYVVDAAALADETPGGTAALRVWVVVDEPGRTEDDVRADVSGHLAAASVPEQIMPVDSLPRLHSGKVDYRELVRRTATHHATGTAGTSAQAAAAATSTEAGVAEEFARVLGVAVPPPGANFFGLGGHSLLALDLNDGLARRFGVDVTLHDVLRHPRVAALAQVIDGRRAEARPAGPADTAAVEPGLTAAERPIWAWTQLFPHDGSANVVAGFRTAEPLSDDEITAALDRLVHDTPQLRLNYGDDHGRPTRTIRPPRPAQVRTVVLTGPVDDCERPEVRAEFYRPFDIAGDQLVRAVVVRSSDSPDVAVCLVVHHIVCDGVGLATLLADLRRRLVDGIAAAPTEVASVPTTGRVDASGHWRQVRDRLRATPRSPALRAAQRHPEPGFETLAVSAAHTVAEREELPLPAVLVEFVAEALLRTLDTDAVVVETPVSLRTPGQARAVGNYVVDVPIVVARTTPEGRAERRRAVAADLLDAVGAAHAAPGFGAARPDQGLAPVGDAVVVLEHDAAPDPSGATTPIRVPGSPPRNPFAFYVVADGGHLDCRVLSRVSPALARRTTTEFRALTAETTQSSVRQECQWPRT